MSPNPEHHPRARRPRPHSAHYRVSESVRCSVAELARLSEEEGPVTPRLWHERIRPDRSYPVARLQFNRMKHHLSRLGVPHERVSVVTPEVARVGGPPAVALRILVPAIDLDDYFLSGAAPSDTDDGDDEPHGGRSE